MVEDLKGIYPEGVQFLAASSCWFSRFKDCSGFHNVKVSGQAASGDIEVAEKFHGWLQKVMMNGGEGDKSDIHKN